MKNLSELNIGDEAIINKILTKGSMRRRFLDIGLIENTKVQCVGISPAGNPKAFLIRGAVIAIRNEDSADILITEV